MMKRTLIPLMAVLGLLFAVIPILANETCTILIEGNPFRSEIMRSNDRIYVPIRFVAEKMNCQVDYVNGDVLIKRIPSRPKIVGDDKFISSINTALDLLQAKDPAGYALVCQNADKIGIHYEDAKSLDHDVFALSYSREIVFTPSGMSSKYWVPDNIAATIVHEAVHCTQLRTNNDRVKRNEYEAYCYKLTTLKLLDSPQWLIDGCLEVMDAATK